jgi:hypothetical protein
MRQRAQQLDSYMYKEMMEKKIGKMYSYDYWNYFDIETISIFTRDFMDENYNYKDNFHVPKTCKKVIIQDKILSDNIYSLIVRRFDIELELIIPSSFKRWSNYPCGTLIYNRSKMTLFIDENIQLNMFWALFESMIKVESLDLCIYGDCKRYIPLLETFFNDSRCRVTKFTLRTPNLKKIPIMRMKSVKFLCTPATRCVAHLARLIKNNPQLEKFHCGAILIIDFDDYFNIWNHPTLLCLTREIPFIFPTLQSREKIKMIDFFYRLNPKLSMKPMVFEPSTFEYENRCQILQRYQKMIIFFMQKKNNIYFTIVK